LPENIDFGLKNWFIPTMDVQIFSTPVLVSAVALVDAGSRVLMQRRRSQAMHGGLWEFPGGKLESGEAPETAAVREIGEELGISVATGDLAPVGFASDGGEAAAPLVILLYICRRWTGDPQPHDAEELGWFACEELAGLEMPPLDYPLAEALVRALAHGD